MAPPRFWRSRSQRSFESATTLAVPPAASQAQSQAQAQAATIPEQSQLSQPTSNASSALTIRPGQTTPTQASTLPTLAQQPTDDNQQRRRSSLATRSPTLYIIVLTLSLLGAQLAWSLELSYGTPFLLSLGLSPQTTSLVWLAGPISGLVAQPFVGHLSDEATNRRWRRRAWIIGSTAFIVVATFVLAFSEPVAEAIVDFFAIGLGDWDPVRNRTVRDVTKILAIGAFWVLDFALNGLQASARSLVLDRLDARDVDRGNAWQGRMTHMGNILGYAAGWLDLSRLAILRPLGGDQFRKFAIIALVGLVLSVTVTCVFVKEGGDEDDDEYEQQHDAQAQGSTFSSSATPKATGVDDERPSMLKALGTALQSIWTAIKRLPRPIRRVCLVQLFAFNGWFPFLFYSTTWIGTFEPRGASRKMQEARERRGTEGMLLFAIVGLVAGSLLPLFSLGRRRSASFSSKAVDKVLQRLFPRRRGQAARTGISLRTFWTAACLMHAALFLLGTFIASTTAQATAVVALAGIPWAIACWAPFSLVMSFVREAEQGTSPFEFPGDYWDPQSRGGGGESGVRGALENCEPLGGGGSGGTTPGSATPRAGSFVARGSEIIRDRRRAPARQASRSSTAQDGASKAQLRRVSGQGDGGEGEEDDEDDEEEAPLLPSHVDAGDDAGERGKGGTILGIHNLSIVLPQLFVSFVASIIFSFFNKGGDGSGGAMDGSTPGVAWVLRFGGVAMLLAAACTRLVPLVEAERAALRRG